MVCACCRAMQLKDLMHGTATSQQGPRGGAFGLSLPPMRSPHLPGGAAQGVELLRGGVAVAGNLNLWVSSGDGMWEARS